MPKATALERRYYVRIGREQVPQTAEEVEAQKGGAALSTSGGAIRHYIVTVNEDSAEDTLEGMGSSWEEAEEDLAAQLPEGTA